MSKEIELKPCPHCGDGKPLVLWTDGNSVCHVECPYCELCGPAALKESDAILTWNDLQRALAWSSEPPTEPGLYLYQKCTPKEMCADMLEEKEEQEKFPIRLVRIEHFKGYDESGWGECLWAESLGVYDENCSGPLEYCEPLALWLGPIPEPKEAKR